MKALLSLFIFSSALALAQNTDETFFLSPSVFYTKGIYSTKQKSHSTSFYNTLQLFDKFYLINNYEYLLIDHKDYDYKQQTFLAGGIFDLFPYYFKFNYAHFKGDYNYKPFTFVYNDFTNLYNLDLTFYSDWNYFGAAYTHLNQIGSADVVSHQITLRFERIVSNEFFVSFKPNFVHIDNRTNLFSAAFKIHYTPIPDMVLKTGGFAGERIFYFDSDLLTIFNQNYIQKSQFFGQIEYSPISMLKIIAGYQHNRFTDFNVDYLYAGIKANFYIYK